MSIPEIDNAECPICRDRRKGCGELISEYIGYSGVLDIWYQECKLCEVQLLRFVNLNTHVMITQTYRHDLLPLHQKGLWSGTLFLPSEGDETLSILYEDSRACQVTVKSDE